MFKNKRYIAYALSIFVGVSALMVGCNKEDNNVKDNTEADNKRKQEIEAYGNNTPLLIGYSDMDTNINPFFSDPSKENSLASFTHIKLLATDSKGIIINKGLCSTGDYSDVKNNIADINASYDEENDKTTYTIDIHKGVKFSDDSEFDADDVIFSYYVYADPSYDGPVNIDSYNIVGLKDYQYNSDKADEVVISDANAKKLLANPGNKMKESIKTLISETLKTEITRVETLYDDPQWDVYTDVYSKKLDLFVALYGLDEEYETGNKEENEVLQDIINQYGYDYKKLAKKYGGEENYFDSYLILEAKELLFNNEISKNKKDVPSIEGIKKTGEYQVEITVNGKDYSAVYGLFDVYIASLTGYGECYDSYDYENNNFGIKRGEISSIKSKKNQPSSNAYVYYKADGGNIILVSNKGYYCGEPFIGEINLIKMEENELVESIANETIDMAICNATKNVLESINGYNETNTIIGMQDYPYAGYAYVGINADKVNVSGKADSKESRALRNAFTEIFRYYKAETVKEFFGESASIIDYPVSMASWAYVTDASNENVDEEILDIVKKKLVEAGYTFDDATNKFTKAPENALLSYTILIQENTEGENPAWHLAMKAKEDLGKLGITLNVVSEKNPTTFWKSVGNGITDMWAGIWRTPKDPDLYQYYYSGAVNNYYGVKIESIDEMILKTRLSDDYSFKKSAYAYVMNEVMDYGVVEPFYQRKMLFVWSCLTIDEETFDKKSIGSYTGITGILSDIKLKK